MVHTTHHPRLENWRWCVSTSKAMSCNGAKRGQLTQLREDSARVLKLGATSLSALPIAPLISLALLDRWKLIT